MRRTVLLLLLGTQQHLVAAKRVPSPPLSSSSKIPAIPSKISPPNPSPLPPTPAVITTLPIGGIQATADLSRFLADTQDRVYIPTAPICSGSTTHTTYNSSSVLYTHEVNCTVTTSFLQLNGITGEVLRTFNDTAPLNWVTKNYEHAAPNECSVTGVPRGAIAAVDAAGTYLLWAIVVTARGPAVGRSTELLLVRRIELASGEARTLLQFILTNEGLAAAGFPANAFAAYWSAGLSSIALSGPSSVLLFSRPPSYITGQQWQDPQWPSTLGNVGGMAMSVDTATRTVAPHLVGLGTSLTSWAQDDGTGGQYLHYVDSAPVSRTNCYPQADLTMNAPWPGSSGICYAHFVLRGRPAAASIINSKANATSSQRAHQQRLVPFAVALPYNTAEGPFLTVNRNQKPSTAATDKGSSSSSSLSLAAASGSSLLYFADVHRCQVRRLDPETGESTVVAGNDAGGGQVPGGHAGPVCSHASLDGPAAGVPMGRPGRIMRGSPGTVFVIEMETQWAPARIRRITGV